VTNTLAYYDLELITAVISFIVEAPEAPIIFKFLKTTKEPGACAINLFTLITNTVLSWCVVAFRYFSHRLVSVSKAAYLSGATFGAWPLARLTITKHG